MKAKDLRERSTGDLQELGTALRKELFRYRMKNSVDQLEKTSVLRATRRDVARVELILGERAHVEADSKGTES